MCMAQMWTSGNSDTHRHMKKSRRVEQVGTFSIGDMIYTPDP